MAGGYDAIVVGARCAGSPTAMLLARKGYRVLMVDRATFPSDTVSTHLVHPLAVQLLARWGLRDRLASTGCPPIDTYFFDLGDFTISGSPGTDESPVAYCPRRTILDKLLVDAAVEAGAELREGFGVDDLIVEDGRVAGIKGHSKQGGAVEERARVVIGADGRNSRIAELVRPAQYNEKPPILAGYYTYWRGLPTHGRVEQYSREHERRGLAVFPTHDDLTLVIVGWPYAEFAANKKDIEGNYMKAIDLVPEFAERVRGATREGPFAGAAVANYFRKPYGPGWALVGDAGYNKDFITAQGILDAFRDAELCAHALDQTFSGASTFEAAMAAYQATRDTTVEAIYELTYEFASLKPPPPEMQALLKAISRSQDAMDGFVRATAGPTTTAEFFSPKNAEAIFAAAA
jgi:flavin-dependent dehydrogenase